MNKKTIKLIKDFNNLIDESKFVFETKQRCYGPRGISRFGEYGILVRCFDKLTRIQNMLECRADGGFEARSETWRDLGIYCFMAILCNRGNWPGCLPMIGRSGGERVGTRVKRDKKPEHT